MIQIIIDLHLFQYPLGVNHIILRHATFTVPLVAVFTKFDGQIINEYVMLSDMENEANWDKAKENAESTFQTVYLHKVLKAEYPPKAYVRLQGENDKHSTL